MAYVDFHFVWSGKFAKLKDPTKAVLYVITAICNRNTGEFYHTVPTIAQKAGVSRSSARAALRELESHDPPIIVSYPRPGKPAIKVHLPTAQFRHHTPAGYAGPPAGYAGVPRQDMPGSSDENGPQIPEPPGSIDLPFPPNNSLNNKDPLTTTAADRISPALIARMTQTHGAKIVVAVVSAMRSMNGEVENADAYFRTCVANGWIPTSKKARQTQEAQARLAELQDELERAKADTDMSHFQEDPRWANSPGARTPQEIKADLVQQYEAQIASLREATEYV